ncbi:MAG: beta-ketoacyl-ACP synthase II [Candidatus Omnitrophota bacterium]
MRKKRVVITGIGSISPLGNDISSFWRNIVAGKSGIGKITSFDASAFDSRIAGEVRDFDASRFFSSKELRRAANFVRYAVAGANEAVRDAQLNLNNVDVDRIGVFIGSGIGSLQAIEEQHKVFLQKGPKRISPFLIPTLMVNGASGYVSISLGLKGPNSCVATACASGSQAIGDAFRIIQRGDADAMVTGGTESTITNMGVGGFCALKALSRRNDEPERASRPFERDRDGFVMSEGSGIILLEDLGHALKRNAVIYAELIGYGMSGDAYHITAPDPTADGAMRAMVASLKDAEVKPDDVSYINAHGTSTLLNDRVETLAIKKLFDDKARKVAVSSTKSMTGHLLGAAGGIEFIVCALAIKHSLIPPTINYERPDPECDLDYVPNHVRQSEIEVAISNSLGFGGHNATLVLRKFR